MTGKDDFGFGPNIQVVRKPKKSNNLVIGLCIAGAVLLMTALFASVMFFYNSAVKIGSDVISEMPEEDFYEGYDEYGDEYEYYEPSADDPYYREFVDSTRTDLDYKVCWVSESVDPDDYEEEWSYYTTYPILEAAEGSNEHYDSINEAIRKKALIYRNIYRNYAGGASTYGYVTYMDENKISIAFQNSIYDANGTLPVLDAITFDVKSGLEIPYGEIISIDQELAMRFRAQDKIQNGGVEYVQNLNDEKLLKTLKNKNETSVFYTPVGVEIGFNYISEEFGSGWVTVTIKEQTL